MTTWTNSRWLSLPVKFHWRKAVLAQLAEHPALNRKRVRSLLTDSIYGIAESRSVSGNLCGVQYFLSGNEPALVRVRCPTQFEIERKLMNKKDATKLIAELLANATAAFKNAEDIAIESGVLFNFQLAHEL